MQDWIATKADLVARYPWLPSLLNGRQTLDEVIVDAANAAAAMPCPYDAYRVEPLLSDLSRLLDRLFSYRKEGYDLDIAATTWALDYQLFKDQLAGQIALEQLTYIAEQRKIERDAQTQAALDFAAANDPLAPGFKDIASGNRDSAATAANGELTRQQLVQDKWNLLDQHQDELQARHTFPGGSLNFKERLDRLQRLLTEDVQEAYQKGFACQLGLKIVFGINLSFPAIDGHFLDNLLIWTRAALRQLEIDQQDDVEFEHIVFLVQPLGNGRGSGVIVPATYTTNMAPTGSGELAVDLTRYFDPAFGRIWVRGVGLSTSDTDPRDASHRLYRLSAQIFPPPVEDPFSAVSSATIKRPPAILTNITITDPTVPVRMYRGANVTNLDPAGIWTIRVNGTLGFPDDSTVPRNTGQIKDLKLHLLLNARPKKSTTDWPPIAW